MLKIQMERLILVKNICTVIRYSRVGNLDFLQGLSSYEAHFVVSKFSAQQARKIFENECKSCR